jgi:hypothetical protein
VTPALKEAFEREMAEARRFYCEGRFDQSFKHLETAHVLGQRHVSPHIRTHWLMLKIGLRRRSAATLHPLHQQKLPMVDSGIPGGNPTMFCRQP